MSRTAVAILSTENLRHNVSVIRKFAPHSKLIAMVKANGYGHGIRSVATRLEGSVDILGVASIDEALALRKCGIKSPILLAEGVFEATELLQASTEKFHVVIHSEVQMEWLKKASLPSQLTVWLKVDTGMGRLGFQEQRAKAHYDTLLTLPQVRKPIGVISHFACADQKDHPLNAQQVDRFSRFMEQQTNKAQSHYSFCNSAALINFPQCAFDYIRPGLALYGVSPIPGVSACDLGLRPVMTLQSSLIAIDTLPKGATIGYGARYTCPENMPVGIIAFGYGDGYPITASDGTPVLINHTPCPLVGRVSMDMMAIDLRPLFPKDFPGIQSYVDTQPGTDKPSHPGTSRPSHPGTDRPSHPGTDRPSHPGTDRPSHPGTSRPSHPGTDKPSHPGTDVPVQNLAPPPTQTPNKISGSAQITGASETDGSSFMASFECTSARTNISCLPRSEEADARNLPVSAAIGDPVILWGEGLPIETVATYTQNLTYSMLTGIQNRVKFLWTRED